MHFHKSKRTRKRRRSSSALSTEGRRRQNFLVQAAFLLLLIQCQPNDKLLSMAQEVPNVPSRAMDGPPTPSVLDESQKDSRTKSSKLPQQQQQQQQHAKSSFRNTRPTRLKGVGNADAPVNNNIAADSTATNAAPSSKTNAETNQQRQSLFESQFLSWCAQVLGIYSILEIQTFEYYDYMRALPVEDDYWEPEMEAVPTVEELPKIPVRGLAASRDISEGEVVIRIPLQALLTVSTTIDQDPVLSRVMGPEARKAYGWMDEGDDDVTSYLVEMPLLAVALLHHKRLGNASPLSPYMRILESTSVDRMPFLWSPERLRNDVSQGIRTIARGIQQEVRDMYESIVQVLIDQHPDLFGPDNYQGELEWMFSLEKFQWAFALTNSRHWELPIEDLQVLPRQKAPVDTDAAAPGIAQDMPAGTPTEQWVQQHGDVDDDQVRVSDEYRSGQKHAFLAPVADLLNFGPPCTSGRYNAETHSFDIVATCSFKKGQEVTFYYSDECEHNIVGTYGFTHPIVPKCKTNEEYRLEAEDWKWRAQALQEKLDEAFDDFDTVYADLRHVESILSNCDCCLYEEPAQEPASRLRREPENGARGSSTSGSSKGSGRIERHGVRRMWRDRRSEYSEF